MLDAVDYAPMLIFIFKSINFFLKL